MDKAQPKKGIVHIAEYYDGQDSGIQGVFATGELAAAEAEKVEDEGDYGCSVAPWPVQGTKEQPKTEAGKEVYYLCRSGQAGKLHSQIMEILKIYPKKMLIVEMDISKDKEIDRLEAENQRLREILMKEVDDGRAEVDDIGIEAWIEQALKRGKQ